MNNELAERDLFEAELRKSQLMAGESEEYAFLALQRSPDGGYSTTWVRSAWIGWKMARAQPAQQASAGSIVDDSEFLDLACKFHQETACEEFNEAAYNAARAALIACIDSRPRQADQQAPPSKVATLSKRLVDMGVTNFGFTRGSNQNATPEQIAAAISGAIDQIEQAPDTVRDDALAIAAGYEGGTLATDPTQLGATIHLHYKSPAEAENAFCAITNIIDSEIALESTAPKLADGEGE